MFFNNCFPTQADKMVYDTEPDSVYTLDHQMLQPSNRIMLSSLWVILMLISPVITVMLGHLSLFVPGSSALITDAYRESYSIFAGINSVDLLLIEAKLLLTSPVFWAAPVYFALFAKIAYIQTGCNEYVRHFNRLVFCFMVLTCGLVASVVIVILVSYSAYVNSQYADQYLEGKGFKRSVNNQDS